MKKIMMIAVFVLLLPVLLAACGEKTEGAATLPFIRSSEETERTSEAAAKTGGDRTSEASRDSAAAESAQADPLFRLESLSLCSYAGGPPYPGEDRKYEIRLIRDGEDYIGSLSKYGIMTSRRLHAEEVRQIEALLDEENVSAWDGYDVRETGLYDGFSLSFSIKYSDGRTISGSGYGRYPENYTLVKSALEKILSPEEIYSDIRLSLADGPILPSGTEILDLKIINAGSEPAGFGRFFRLFRKEENEWKEIPWKDGATVTGEWIIVPPYNAAELSADIKYLTGSPLREGEYRIEWTVLVSQTEQKISAEFCVTK